MKALGIAQFEQKKFDLLGFDGKWKDSLGDVPTAFSAIIYGQSGNGKTEMCLQLARYLANFDKVAWFSYEQGHGIDLRMAIQRNRFDEVPGRIILIDPLENMKEGMSLFDELYRYLGRRGTPRFIFIDSVDYCSLTWEQVKMIKEKFRKKKSIIWISHAQGNGPKSEVGKRIEYDAGVKVQVKKFIAYTRSRFGGMQDYIIYEERARELNPLYFGKSKKLKSKRPKK